MAARRCPRGKIQASSSGRLPWRQIPKFRRLHPGSGLRSRLSVRRSKRQSWKFFDEKATAKEENWLSGCVANSKEYREAPFIHLRQVSYVPPTVTSVPQEQHEETMRQNASAGGWQVSSRFLVHGGKKPIWGRNAHGKTVVRHRIYNRRGQVDRQSDGSGSVVKLSNEKGVRQRPDIFASGISPKIFQRLASGMKLARNSRICHEIRIITIMERWWKPKIMMRKNRTDYESL